MKGYNKMDYIWVLDFGNGKVYRYNITTNWNFGEWSPEHEKCEEFLVDMGHNLKNIEWMCTDVDYVSEG